MDERGMQELSDAVWTPGARWHPGELTWSRLQHLGRAPDWPTRVWRRGSTVLAWGWVDLPGSLYLQTRPESADLVGEVLDWAEPVATGPLSVHVLDRERHLVDSLHANGYAESTVDGPFFRRMVGGLDELLEVVLPQGFTVAEATDIVARVGIHRAAFHPSRVTVDSYTNVARAWLYRRELDLVVHAPDGRLAAFCLGWLDSRSRVGTFEPVGTDPGFRGLGLARAVCLAVLHRMRALGASTATVLPRGDAAYPVPARLYAGLGLSPIGRTVVFTRTR
ncbi:GNAT family N-acetyltransferase [Crossiella sp. CA198]|uniref:GNAT family N-acetyltransferase n=1 Tax=Crossiella sp. CA198 TaxID=3455607 RepID=UPI003F8D301B